MSTHRGRVIKKILGWCDCCVSVERVCEKNCRRWSACEILGSGVNAGSTKEERSMRVEQEKERG